MSELTQKQVQSLFDYKNGNLYWKVQKNSRSLVGDKAGSLDHHQYYIIGINNKYYRTHRLIFLYHHGYLPNQIDHIDRNSLNNNIENLRESIQSQNMMNRKSDKNSSSQYKGVSWINRDQKWSTQIQINGKKKSLGYFTSEIKAAKAYNNAAIKYFKEYAKLNEV